MKAGTNYFKVSTYLFIIFIVFSCSKERIDEIDLPEYSSLDDFYQMNELPEQDFVIDTIYSDTIIGMHGTKIWGLPKEKFMKKSNHEDINYPYILKLTEAYSIKDMIFAGHQNLAQNYILYSAGNLRFRAFKDDDELVLKEYFGINFLAPAENPTESMELYYGFTEGTSNDWNNDVLQTNYLFTNDIVSSIDTDPYGYKAKTAKMGWLNIANKYSDESQADIEFSAEGTNTDFIDIYVIFNDMHSYIKVSNLYASDLPEGEQITVFAIAKSSSEQMYYYKESFTSLPSLNVELEMIEASENEILTIMELL